MEINRKILVQSFRDETEDCLDQMEHHLLKLKAHPQDRERISSLFRAAHTLRGNASVLDFKVLAHSVRSLEDLLDVLRSHSLALSQELISLLLQSVHVLRQMATKMVTGEETLVPAREQLFIRLGEIAAEHKHTAPIAARKLKTHTETGAFFMTLIGNS